MIPAPCPWCRTTPRVNSPNVRGASGIVACLCPCGASGPWVDLFDDDVSATEVGAREAARERAIREWNRIAASHWEPPEPARETCPTCGCTRDWVEPGRSVGPGLAWIPCDNATFHSTPPLAPRDATGERGEG